MRKKSRRKRKRQRHSAQPETTNRSIWWAALLAGVGAAFILFHYVTNGPREQGALEPGTTVPPAASGTVGAPSQEVPPFYVDPGNAKPFPATLEPSRFLLPFVARAYAVAREIPEVLVQQPCYCYCDGYGHQSLLDCYASHHGAG